jgi:hypothetical protein
MDMRVGWGLPGGTASGHYIDHGMAICDFMTKTGIVSIALPMPEAACLECASLVKATGGLWPHRHHFELPGGASVLGCRCGKALVGI